MALANTSVLVVERAPPNGCHQYLYPRGWAPMTSCLSRRLSKISRWSDPGSFQTAVSALGPRACEILYTPFKSGDSISHSPLGLPKSKPQWPPKPKFQGLVQNRSLGSPMWASDPSLLEENLCNCNHPPVCGSPTWGYGS